MKFHILTASLCLASITWLSGCAATGPAGIELPLKALVWSDAAGKVMLSYNDPATW